MRKKVKKKASNKIRINDRIDAPHVRVIEYRGRQLGILPIAVALNLAAEKRLDLVEIAPTANPPICCLVDYAAFLVDYAAFQPRKRKA